MAAPTNISGATAIELGPLPHTVTQDVNDGGTTYTVWYKYTAQVGDNVIGVFAHSDDLALYKPVLALFTPDAVTAFPMVASANVPAQFPVTAAQVYYLRLTSQTGNVATAQLTIAAARHVDAPVPGGAILIPDDLPGYPMAVIDPTTGAVTSFVPHIPAGETATHWSGGSWAMEAWITFPSQTTTIVRAYDSSFTQIFSTVIDPTDFQHAYLSSNRTDNWYVLLSIDNHIGGGGPTIQRLNSAGTVTATWLLTPYVGPGSYYRPRSLATARDDSVAYIGDTLDGAVKRWNLVTDAALSDLVANLSGYYPLELLVLADESLVVCWWTQLEFGYHGDVVLRRYSPGGGLLNDYGSFGDCLDPRLAAMCDDPLTFWFDQKPYPLTDGLITVLEIRASDGVVVSSVPTIAFDQGKYEGTPTLSPPALFGRSESCPLIILPPSGGCGSGPPEPPDGGGGDPHAPPHVAPSYHLDARYIRRLRRAPHVAQEHLRVFYRRFELDLERGQGLATGQGADPMVLLRISRDGGQTWGEESRMAAGKLGEYTARVIARRLGQARDTVFEVVVSDPIAWSLVGAWLDLEAGTN